MKGTLVNRRTKIFSRAALNDLNAKLVKVRCDMHGLFMFFSMDYIQRKITCKALTGRHLATTMKNSLYVKKRVSRF